MRKKFLFLSQFRVLHLLMVVSFCVCPTEVMAVTSTSQLLLRTSQGGGASTSSLSTQQCHALTTVPFLIWEGEVQRTELLRSNEISSFSLV